ncbi:MAG: glycosyltransferase involved in cell wall biosynthesis [Saprospiraceae bacterium]|jgi:glycosyltransferase involved in cell wall biosynthesis
MTQTAHKKKFKICLVSISLAKGGAERSVAMLSQMLSSLGHQVHIVVLNNEIDFKHSGTILNLGILKSNSDYFLARLFRFKKLRRYLTTQSFDVVIDHRPKNEYFRELFYSKYVYKKTPFIYVVHSSNKEEYFTKEVSKMASIYEEGLATIAVSNHIHEHIVVANGISSGLIIHNAYNPAWQEQPSSETHLPTNYILSYGRIYDAIKDFSFLIKSFNASQVWRDGVSLVIMGDGPDKEMLQDLVKNQACKKHIVFLPFTKEPFGIIKNARCVTLTSTYEGFPMVLVESLSLGIPVVSLDIVSGPSEIIQHEYNGLLIKERSLDKFADALRVICKDEVLYLKLKAQAQGSVTQFSMQEISEKWNKLLHHVIR